MPAWARAAAAAAALARTGNGMLAAAGTLVGMVVAEGNPPLAAWLAAPAAALLVAAFGNVLNDLRDLPIDRAAHPERPLPSGRLSPLAARWLAALALAAGLSCAWLAAGWPTLAFAAGNAALLSLYEWRLKALGLAGNATVALLVASTFPFGALAAAGWPAWGHVVWLLAALALLSNLGRELVKDLEDAPHDAGRRTFPRRHGRSRTCLLAFGLVNAAVLLSLPAVLAAPPSWWPWWWVALAAADLAFLAGAALAWVSPRRSQQALKAAMALALAAFLAGPLAG